MKIPLLVFMSDIKIDLTLKKSNFLFLLCFKIAKIKLDYQFQFHRGIYNSLKSIKEN